MKHNRRHTIVVSTWNEDKAHQARHKAAEMFCSVEDGNAVSPIQASGQDNYSFLIPFEGSETGCTAQDTFIRWLEEQQDRDGSRSYAWRIH